MARRPGLVVALALTLAACGGPAPSTSARVPVALPTSVAPPLSPSPAVGPELVIEGAGSVECSIPGCRASVELVPGLAPTASLDRNFQPVGGWDFDVIGDGRAGGTATIGRIRDAPPSIAPGTYRVVGAISIVSDGRSGAPDASGHYPLALMYWDLCEANLKVTSEMISVRIDIEYSLKGGCKLTTGFSIS